MVVVVLTGGIGSGKSTVARMLRDLGAPVIASDELAREVVAPGSPALAEIRAAFGESVLRPDGSLDRAALGQIVFGDAAARRRLEAITHPRIRALSDEREAALRAAGEPACVLDIPLYYEAGYDKQGIGDVVWVVRARRETQLRRVMARDGLDEVAARARLDAQWPLEEKVARADVVIENDGPIEATRAQVEAAWSAVLKRAQGA